MLKPKMYCLKGITQAKQAAKDRTFKEQVGEEGKEKSGYSKM